MRYIALLTTLLLLTIAPAHAEESQKESFWLKTKVYTKRVLLFVPRFVHFAAPDLRTDAQAAWNCDDINCASRGQDFTFFSW